jgi:hypothetical protein
MAHRKGAMEREDTQRGQPQNKRPKTLIVSH